MRRLLDSARFDPPLYYNIGNHLARLGDARTAALAYRKAIDQRQGNYPRALNNLGVVLLRAGDWADAEEAFLRALRQENFTYAEAHYNLGRLYHARGDAELAIRSWQRTFRLQPMHAPAAVMLARALAAEGEAREAMKILDLARPANEAARSEIAAARLAVGAWAREAPAVAKRSSSAAKTPGSRAAGSRYTLDAASFAVLQSARESRERGKYDEAAALYRRVLKNNRGSFPPAELELGYALISLRRNAEALQLLEPLSARHSAEFPIVHYHLARLYEAQGDLDRAAANYTRAVVLFGDRNPQFLLDLSRVRERQGDNAAALTAFEAYIAANERTGNDTADWTVARLAALREQAATTSAPPKP